MSRARIGELLCHMVPLTGHDVDEILQEQRVTPKRFGEVAIALGMCRPEHVWQAWATQHSDEIEGVDLELVGIDSQAITAMTADTARRLNCVPVRQVDDTLIVATGRSTAESTVSLSQALGRRVKLVVADDAQVALMLDRYYPDAH